MLFIGIFAGLLTTTQDALAREAVHGYPKQCSAVESPQHLIQNISVQFPDINTIYAYLNASGEKEEFESITNGTDVGTPFGYKISVVEK